MSKIVDILSGSNRSPTVIKDVEVKIGIEEIIRELSNEHLELLKLETEDAHKLLESKIEKLIRSRGLDQSSEDLLQQIKNHIFGYGILEKYIKDPAINNIYVNSHNDIWIQKGLSRVKVNEAFDSPDSVLTFIQIIVANLSGEINKDNPISTLSDHNRNLRIICAIEPAVQNCPTIVIRKHQNIDENLSLSRLIELNMISDLEAAYLINQIDRGKNIIFTGIGGSGKTTLLRGLVNKTSELKRIMVIEESTELQISKPNTIAYKVKRNTRGKTIGLGDYIEIGLKSSIELFIFGETRGEEAMALYDAAFSGHQVLTTLHTDDPNEVPERLLINMKKSGTDIPSDTLMQMVYKSVDLIVQMKELKVESISKVTKDSIERIDNIGGGVYADESITKATSISVNDMVDVG